MKIRNGYVSNSSSSSFIIVDEPQKPPCECCGRGYPDLEQMINEANLLDYESEVKAVGKEEISDYLCRDTLGECSNKVDKILESIRLKPDEKIMLVDVSYHNEVLNDAVRGCRVCVNENEWYD